MRNLFALTFFLIFLGCNENPYKDMATTTPTGRVETKENDLPQRQPVSVEFKMFGELSKTITEDQEIVQKIEIKNSAHPHGPFRVFLDGFPSGTSIQMKTPSSCEIRFKPGYDFVVGPENRNVEAFVHALDQDDHAISAKLTWTITNNYLAPLIIGPSRILQSSVVNFTLIAEDPNGEVFPDWKILDVKGLGNIKGYEVQIQPTRAQPHPATEFDVVWTNVPPELLGRTITLKLRACTSSSKLCSTQAVQVQLVNAKGGEQ